VAEVAAACLRPSIPTKPRFAATVASAAAAAQMVDT